MNNSDYDLRTIPEGDDFGNNQEIIRAALDHSVSGIIITDNRLPDNPIIYCNRSFENITGYHRDEIIGHNCRFLQGKDRGQDERAALKSAIIKGENINVEIRNYRKDGELFWNELFVSPIKNKAGEVTHFIGIQHDVTRRKNAELNLRHEKSLFEQKVQERTKSLQMTQEYLNSIVQTIRESLLVLDNDLTVLTVNEHFLRTFKVSRADTVGKGLYSLGNGQWDIERLKELLQKILPTNNPVLDFEVEHDFPHIGKKLMLLNAHRIELDGDFKDRILLAIEDITDRRSIEQRKDDFLSIASHELKTPLTTVKGYIQVLDRLLPPDISPKVREIVKKTDTQLERLNRLIAELLDVSKIQSGKLELHRDHFNFGQMIRETVDALQASTPNHQLLTDGTADVQLWGDEAQLSQVVTNLLSNAVKYSPDAGSVQVYISVVSNFIKCSITDQGVGISINDQRRIFERFYRVGKIQKRYPGMGIGLYICEQIVKQHGGALWVESEEEKGSTFSFTLPLTERKADA